MKSQHHPIALAGATVALAALAALGLGGSAPARAAEKASPQVERGRYLVASAGCGDCHTPLKMGAAGPEPDLARMLSGHPEGLQMPPAPALPAGPWAVIVSATNTAWSGPWGMSFTANLTPDPETGLGRWSERDFVQTIRSGRHMGKGRPLLPPMPITVADTVPWFRMESVPELPALLATSTPPVGPRLTALLSIVMKPVPLGPPNWSNAPAADPVKLIDEPPHMFSVPVPAARALVPPRMTLALAIVLLMLMAAPFTRFSTPSAPTPRATRTPAPNDEPLKKMTPSRSTVALSIVATPAPPLSAMANRDALMRPPDATSRV